MRLTLNRAAGALDLPERFQKPSQLVLAAGPAPGWHRRYRRALSVAAAIAVLMAGLTLTQPGRTVVAAALQRLSWISVDSRTLEQRMGDFKNAKPHPAPPADIEQAAMVDPAEARRQGGYVEPLKGDSFRLTAEMARKPARLEKDGKWVVGEGNLQYVQNYLLQSGEKLTVAQEFIPTPENGTRYEFPPGTREIEVLGHPAYLSTRHIAFDAKGREYISEFPLVHLFIQAPGQPKWLELTIASQDPTGKQATVEQLLQFAEAFTAHAVKALSGQ